MNIFTEEVEGDETSEDYDILVSFFKEYYKEIVSQISGIYKSE
jgi:hypothetical protein